MLGRKGDEVYNKETIMQNFDTTKLNHIK